MKTPVKDGDEGKISLSYSACALGVKNSNQFRDLVLQQRDALVSAPQQSAAPDESNNVLVEIRDILQKISENISNEG